MPAPGPMRQDQRYPGKTSSSFSISTLIGRHKLLKIRQNVVTVLQHTLRFSICKFSVGAPMLCKTPLKRGWQ